MQLIATPDTVVGMSDHYPDNDARSTVDAAWFDRLERLLSDRGWTKYKLASQIGVSPSRLTHWRKGIGLPSLFDAYRICQVLDCPMEWLCNPDDKSAPPLQRSDEERLLLDLVRPIGVRRALQILVSQAATLVSPTSGEMVPLRSIEVRHEPPDPKTTPSGRPETRTGRTTKN